MTSRPSTEEPCTIRIAGPGELVATVPYLVGHRPRRSLVLVGLHGPRQLCGVVCRVDLPPRNRDGGDPVRACRGLARQLAAQLVTQRGDQAPDRVAALVYDERPGRAAGPPWTRLVDALSEVFDEVGAPLAGACRVGEDRFWTYGCADPVCCPPTGAPLPPPESSPAVARLVVAGRSCLPDRDAVAAVVEPGPGAEQTTRDVGWQRQAWADRDPMEVALDGEDAFGRLVDRQRRGEPLDHADVVGVLAAMADPLARDLLGLTWVSWLSDPETAVLGRPDHHDAVTAVLLALAIACDGPPAAAPLTLYALQCWTSGDGALANVAVDRALQVHPGYTMAELVSQLLASGMLPHGVPPYETW